MNIKSLPVYVLALSVLLSSIIIYAGFKEVSRSQICSTFFNQESVIQYITIRGVGLQGQSDQGKEVFEEMEKSLGVKCLQD